MYEEMIIRARSGDREALAFLTEKLTAVFEKRVERWFRQQPEDRKDAIQEALVNICEFLPRLRDPQKFIPWSYRILHNTCRRIYRANKKQHSITLQLADRVSLASALLVEKDGDIWERLDRLTELERTIVILHRCEHFSIRTIASELNLSVGVVKYRLHKARSKLRNQFDLYND
jgi:RNA polymerase sigma-70 factor (ECF subfamily)